MPKIFSFKPIFFFFIFFLTLFPGILLAGEENVLLPPFDQTVNNALYFVLLSAILGLLYGVYLAFKVIKKEQGTPKMIEVAKAIQEGAKAYLARQFRVLFFFIILLTIVLFFVYKNIYVLPDGTPDWKMVWGIALSFLAGSTLSAMTGLIGMSVAVRGNVRVAHAARTSFKNALETAFQSGTVTGMFTIGMGLVGATVIFMLFKEKAMMVLIGFGFGGSLVALFMRVGGGIYTKAADVGADLVGKIEAGIPEDDPRNAAVIADLVGDNVGDCAGMAADLFESYEVTLVAAMILGASYAVINPTIFGRDLALKLIIFPLLVRAVGVFASILGTWSVKGKDTKDFNPMRPIQNGFVLSALSSTIGFGLINYFYIKTSSGAPDMRFFLATFSGIVLAILISYLTEYYTAVEYSPVKETARATKTGPATTILAGFSEGMESTVLAILAISLAIIVSNIIFAGDIALAAYGIALCGMGMLTTTGFIVSMDSYGPVSDNANGIFEMSKVLEEDKNPNAHIIVHKLDAVGNTTKAVTKGFAIASAVVAAVSLFRSYGSDINLLDPAYKFFERGIQINMPRVFVGLLIGGAMPFLFSSLAIRAVGRAAFQVVEEVRRQFREIPGLMEGRSKPEYYKCVNISTAAAQKELITPGLLAILSPLIVGLLLGVDGLGGFLAGTILTGQLLAVMLSNAGGTWDNAKKTIEAGLYGGKGSEAHKAAIIGDTVGDPFKDTAGPSLNPLIKVMNLVSILILPLLIGKSQLSSGLKAPLALLGFVILLVALVISKRRGIIKG
ncbi:MAG: sodium-translocating pyrophosphatase [candidate division Zixibacteria bacterium]|nr:sodium-translocating pyrophosphatase [candidate division Zixibacteria bacterium]